jgi:hypothetical protein
MNAVEKERLRVVREILDGHTSQCTTYWLLGKPCDCGYALKATDPRSEERGPDD